MSLYLVVPLLAFLLCALLGSAIWVRDPSQPSHRTAAGLLACICWWAACEILWNAQDDPGSALTLVRASALGWVWLGPMSLELFLQITSTRRGPRLAWTLRGLYVVSALFLVAAWTSDWIHPGVVATSWGYAYRFGPLYPFFYVFTVGCIAAALAVGWRAFGRSRSDGERQQVHCLALGIAFPLITASITDGLLPLAGLQPPRLGTLSFAGLGAAIAWTFHRHGYSLLAPGSFAPGVLRALRDGVALLRSDGYVRIANPALATMLGLRPDQLLGLRLSDFIEGCPGEEEGEVVDLRCSALGPGGRRLPVAVSTVDLRDKRGSQVGRVVLLRDLAEIVSLRSRLVLSARLAAVGELAAGIAHEINNPLAFVRSNLGVLRCHCEALTGELEKSCAGDAAEELLSESQELLEESIEGVDRAAAIVRDVRGLSHAGSQHRVLAELGPLLEGVLRLVSHQLPSRVAVQTDYGSTPAVSCSPQEIQQVFLNLVLNAAQAIEEAGTIRIATRSEERAVVVSIEDDGTGIAPEHLERIFDPFFTTKPVGEGSGLGLGISYEIVRRHGGEMEVCSTPGRGTRFDVRLPAGTDTLPLAS